MHHLVGARSTPQINYRALRTRSSTADDYHRQYHDADNYVIYTTADASVRHIA